MTETATVCARKARSEIRRQLRDGAFGELPEGLKISVRTSYASLMSAVDVFITAPPQWEHTPAADVLARRLRDIVTTHFTPDGQTRFAAVMLESGLRLA